MTETPGAPQATVSIETLRANYAALGEFLRQRHASTEPVQGVPDLLTLLRGLAASERVPIEYASVGTDAIARQLNEPHLGLKLAPYLRGTHGRLVEFINSVSVRFIDYLRIVARYTRIASEIMEYDIIDSADDIVFYLHPNSPHTISYHQIEGFAALLMRAFEGNSAIRLHAAQFTYARPSDDSQAYLAAFNTVPEFNQAANCLRFPASCRNVVIPGKAEAQECLRVLPSFEARYAKLSTTDSAVTRCQFLLRFLLCLGEANLDRLAATLSVSTRTLNRRLKAEGTSFGQLLQQVRKDIAEQHFRDPDSSCTELGFALGYQDYKQFYRAFKQWFGVAPEQYRESVRVNKR